MTQKQALVAHIELTHDDLDSLFHFFLKLGTERTRLNLCFVPLKLMHETRLVIFGGDLFLWVNPTPEKSSSNFNTVQSIRNFGCYEILLPLSETRMWAETRFPHFTHTWEKVGNLESSSPSTLSN